MAMLRSLAFVFALALCSQLLAQAPTSKPAPGLRKPNAQQDETTKKFEYDPQSQKTGTKSLPLVVQVKPWPQSDVKATDIQSKKDDDSSAKRWGIIMGILGLAIAGGQTYIFKRQLEIFRKQTKIQEAMMGQWIDIDGWKCTENPHKLGLDISFQLINPTGYLLTLKHGEIAFEVEGNALLFFVYRQIPLTPNKPLTIKTFVALNELKMNTFKTGNFGMGVEGKISFINALKDEIGQHFSGILSCSESETKFESSTKLIPSKDGTT